QPAARAAGACRHRRVAGAAPGAAAEVEAEGGEGVAGLAGPARARAAPLPAARLGHAAVAPATSTAASAAATAASPEARVVAGRLRHAVAEDVEQAGRAEQVAAVGVGLEHRPGRGLRRRRDDLLRPLDGLTLPGVLEPAQEGPVGDLLGEVGLALLCRPRLLA